MSSMFMTGCGVIVTGCGVRDRAAAYATEQLAAPAELSCCADAGEAGYRQQETAMAAHAASAAFCA